MIHDAFKDTIRKSFLANGFTIKEGQTDLKDYVYSAVEALMKDLFGSVTVPAIMAPAVRESLETARIANQAINQENDGFAMEAIEQMGFARAPVLFQVDDDPDMLEVVYMANGETLYGLMSQLGYRDGFARGGNYFVCSTGEEPTRVCATMKEAQQTLSRYIDVFEGGKHVRTWCNDGNDDGQYEEQ